jgi:lipopolysaccharide export system ATP-binding protein
LRAASVTADLVPHAHPPHVPIPGEGILAAEGLHKTYGKRRVVNNVSIDVMRGEAVGILGPNGAGKTTCFYMVTGLVEPDAGHISLDGHDVTKLPMYRRARLGIGYLPQEASIFRGLNVENNLRAVLEVVEPNKARREQRLDELLDEFQIQHIRKSPSIALSGGERRRVEIARSLATNPSLHAARRAFRRHRPDRGRRHSRAGAASHARGIGVLITDHNVRETLGLVDRAYIIHSGSVLMEGTPEEIVENDGRSPPVSRRGVPALMAISQKLEMRTSQGLVMTPQLMQAIKLLQLSNLDLVAFVEAELERNPLLEREEPDRARARRWCAGNPGRGIFGANGEASSLQRRLDGRPLRKPRRDGRSISAPTSKTFSPTTLPPRLPRRSLRRRKLRLFGMGSRRHPGRPGRTTTTILKRSSPRKSRLPDHLSRQLSLTVMNPVERMIGQHLIDSVDEAGYLRGDLSRGMREKLGAPRADVEASVDELQTIRSARRLRARSCANVSPFSCASGTASIRRCRR